MATPQKWLLIRHEVYQSLVDGNSAEVPADVPAEVPAEVSADVSVKAEQPAQLKPSRTLRALQMMLANNESIAWPSDDLRLYGQSTGRSAAKVLSGLNRSAMRVDVAQKIVLLILSKSVWKRSDYLAGGLGNVWKKIVRFRRENGQSVARAHRYNADEKSKRAQLRPASAR